MFAFFYGSGWRGLWLAEGSASFVEELWRDVELVCPDDSAAIYVRSHEESDICQRSVAGL